MELDMEKFNFLPVFEMMQGSIKIVLGEHAKALIEQGDYHALSRIAQIGAFTTEYLDDLSDDIHDDYEGSGAILTIVKPELFEAELVEAEETESKESKPKFVFSVPNQETKDWIFDYLGKRGGKSYIEDMLFDFFKDYHQVITKAEIEDGEWREHIFRRVCEMRKNKPNAKNILVPTNGKRLDYYELSKYGMELYQKQVKKVEKQLSLPDLEITG
jgi:hypothetical protein